MEIRIQDLVIEVPELLDGARVLFVAPATPGQTGADYATGDRIAITYFAIAAYPGNEPSVYLFGVSSSNEVAYDSDHESAADAMRTSLASGFTSCAFQSVSSP